MSTILHNGAKPQMTVAEMCAHYLSRRVDVHNKAEDTRHAEYWTEQFGDLPLDDLTRGALARWRTQRLTEVKPATANRALADSKPTSI